jgi:4-amino-4-deoxy-L-arabinose transferase-like glycosyltransferase
MSVMTTSSGSTPIAEIPANTADAGEQLEMHLYQVRWKHAVLLVVLVIHVWLLARQGIVNAPNLDESAHLPAGYSHWQFGNFTLYRVNPPLIRMWAALPLLVDPPQTDWTSFSDGIFSRAEFTVGAAFCDVNGQQTFRYFTLARWMLIPVSILGALVCYRWAFELFGQNSALLALCLWCFCPNLLAWGASITPDTGAAAFGVLAAWRFRRWLMQPTWWDATIAGLTLGLAELTKSSWIILFGLWPLIWCCWRLTPKSVILAIPASRQLCLILVLAVYLLNLGYGFEGSGQQLRDFTFVSRTLGGEAAHTDGGNRFRDSWVGNLPVPVPANYLRGIDLQKHDFERGKWSYLRGEQKEGGWWYYYLYAILVKTPVGFLMLIGVATGLFISSHRYRCGWRDEMMLILPGLAIIVLVSSQTGFNRYLRYVLPAFPYLYIFASRAAIAFRQRSRLLSATIMFLLVAGIVSSLSVFPYSMSYFNMAVGGPAGGRYHLLDGNLDWGQDLLRFRGWVDRHPDATPLYTALTTFVPLESAGIQSEPIRPSHDGVIRPLDPGWYAISVNHLMGYKLHGSDRPECMQFQKMEPSEKIGDSIYLYRVQEEPLSQD